MVRGFGIDSSVPRRRPGFNLIHRITASKFHIFPATSDFHAAQLKRAELWPFTLDGVNLGPVATPEDILLAKLLWYRDGGESSEEQWRDIGGILLINPNLAWDYVNLWAARLHVADLLTRARVEAEQ